MEKDIFELTKKIKQLELELKKLNDNQWYGLKWEEKPEEFEERAKNALPILKEQEKMRIDNKHNLDHLIIEWDNFHSLSTLNYTHKWAIDVIYIDPPYNTGNKDFIYNDNYVDKEDSYRHSKRLSFMNKRLRLAKNLLTESWVVFISIDDNEFSQLKLLCDDVFWDENKIAILPTIMNLKWNNDEFWFSGTHEYSFVYAKNKSLCSINNFPINDEEDLGKWEEDANWYYKKWSWLLATSFWNKREERPYMYFPLLIKENRISFIEDNEYKKIYDSNTKIFNDSFIKELEEKYIKLWFDFVLPISAKWEYLRWTRWIDGKFKTHLDDVIISKTNNGYSFYKKQRPELWDLPSKKAKSIFYKPEYSSWNGTALLQEILWGKLFTSPKPISLIRDFIILGSKKDSIILDFFAGSWTTGHAVLDLNKDDWGNRKFILCSNKENTKDEPNKNICQDITYERVRKIMKWYTNSKGENIEWLWWWNLRYYTTEFIKTTKSTDDLRHRFINLCDDLLCIKENTFEEVETKKKSDYLKLFKKQDRYTVILYDIHHFDELLNLLETTDGKIAVYIFSLSKEIYEEEISYIEKDITIQNIPDDILQTYKKIFNF